MKFSTRQPIRTGILLLFLFLLIPVAGPSDAAGPTDKETLRQYIEEMKTDPRGPFRRIRWFCNDGTVHPPRPYPCEERGGGVQHGEWSEETRILRENGYYIATVLADMEPKSFFRAGNHAEQLKQMILEQFLINADDGWIFRNARYYRGALQVEDEEKGGRQLLLALLGRAEWRNRNFPVLREAVRFLPHGQPTDEVSQMRQLSRTIAEKDPAFEPMRVKLHGQPEAGDATQVRRYAKREGKDALAGDYTRLAGLIDRIYRVRNLKTEADALARKISDTGLAEQVRTLSPGLADEEPAVRLVTAAQLLRLLRQDLEKTGGPEQMLAALDLSLALEQLFFQDADRLRQRSDTATRSEQLRWLRSTADAMYGMGALSPRQWKALAESIGRITIGVPLQEEYKAELDYLARAPNWSDRRYTFHFGDTVEQMAVIAPKVRRYVQDRLRGSPLLFYAAILDRLTTDANALAGVSHQLFGRDVSTGLRGLNPGLARGVLRVLPEGGNQDQLDRNSIYVLPETTEDLPPVAGIITAGLGNTLSHIQLLARNLGIPNVAVDKPLLSALRPHDGEPVVLAVSPAGVVHLGTDGPQWDRVFRTDVKKPENFLIRPDLEKLDLSTLRLYTLSELRAEDSGRLCGPKAANLGELKSHFPEAVTEGVVIPFSFYRAMLNQPMTQGGPSVFKWMQSRYDEFQKMADPMARAAAESGFLEQMREWINGAKLSRPFQDLLRKELERALGPDGTYGVFIRSDTNVEDLPGFTGAGLNLTVPHVVGFDSIVAAIPRVWASPFQERAFRWRQEHMRHPEHVYASVLLMKSIPADKSGVLVTTHLETGDPGWISVAVNEGVGGAVAGQTAEELRVHTGTGETRYIAQATEPGRRILLPEGGLSRIPASGTDAVLTPAEIDRLVQLARTVPDRFPQLRDTDGNPVPADIEFGFRDGELVLFQIRPFLESREARRNQFLLGLDEKLNTEQNAPVDLNRPVRKEAM